VGRGAEGLPREGTQVPDSHEKAKNLWLALIPRGPTDGDAPAERTSAAAAFEKKGVNREQPQQEGRKRGKKNLESTNENAHGDVVIFFMPTPQRGRAEKRRNDDKIRCPIVKRESSAAKEKTHQQTPKSSRWRQGTRSTKVGAGRSIHDRHEGGRHVIHKKTGAIGKPNHI